MSPFGKILTAFIGLCLWGIDGFLWGLFFGHIVVDKSVLNQYLGKKFDMFDCNIRILLPFKYYIWYDRFSELFTNHHFKAFKHRIDIFFDRNLGIIFGALIGFTLKSKILLFSGIIIGYFVDRFNLDLGLKNKSPIKFWRRINPLKLALTSKEAKQVAFIQSMASLSAKVCMVDGSVSENEINTFKKLFNISSEQNAAIANVFYEAQKSKEGIERHAYQISAISRGNIKLQESVIENLFKIATADNEASQEKMELLREISDIIGLPVGNFEVIKKSFKKKPSGSNLNDCYKILEMSTQVSDADLKKRWKKLITLYHPDKVQASGGSIDDIRFASTKMAEINSAYQNIMKSRQPK